MEKLQFGVYLYRLRKTKNVSLEALCDGLCSISLLSRLEKGEREPEKLLQDRLLSRLGVITEDYESFLPYKEYMRWNHRQEILYFILNNEAERAKHLLQKYHNEYIKQDKIKNKLDEQFYLSIYAQIRRQEGATRAEVAELFIRASRVTVTQAEKQPQKGKALAVEEIYLLIEALFYSNAKNKQNCLYAWLAYLKNSNLTKIALAKLLPKTINYLYIEWNKQKYHSMSVMTNILNLCKEAIEVLNNVGRSYYLWELFCIAESLAMKCIDFYKASGEKVPEYIRNQLLDYRELKLTLEVIYNGYSVPIRMQEDSYIFTDCNVYCIEDIVSTRRIMLGLSAVKLCKGICSQDTMRRLEKKEKTPHKAIVRKLFTKLNLSTEFCRREIFTDNQEIINVCHNYIKIL